MPTRTMSKSFEAVLERTGDRLNWTIIRVPLDVAKVWGRRGQLRVKGEINGFAFQTSLFPTGDGHHMMIVNKKMQAGGKTYVGGKARFKLEPDTAPRELKTADELTAVLRQSKRLQKYFDSFNHSMQKYITELVAEGKHKETRLRRADQIAERLMQTMEAERELPPVLQLAFRQNPRAREGWEKMPAGHRRGHLFAISSYRNPESRARRVAKAVEEMLDYAQKAKRRGGAAEEE